MRRNAERFELPFNLIGVQRVRDDHDLGACVGELIRRQDALGGVSVSEAQDRDGAAAQVEFGIKVAQRGLWQEAIYRWERASLPLH